MLIQRPLYVKKSLIHGYGVFAKEQIKQGDTIEECYALFLKEEQSSLGNYVFNANNQSALLTGFGAIYNHADHSNASYTFDEQKQCMVFTARRFIHKDEEILISYGKDWFSSRHAVSKTLSLTQKSWVFLSGLPFRLAVIGSSLILFTETLRALTA